MQLTQSTSMRQELRQLLTPRMIQSMEILQLPLMALEERIEQELASNPVLEMKDGAADGDASEVVEIPADSNGEARDDFSESAQDLVDNAESNGAEDIDRLERTDEYVEREDFYTNSSLNYRQAASYDGERDKKLDALNNTADRNVNLTDHLLDQWSFIEAPEKVLAAGRAIINHIDEQGYL